MAFSKGTVNIAISDILNKVSEFDILHYYFNINSIPCVISSPIRVDNKPSFGFYTLDGNRIYWKDLSKNISGGIWDLLGEYWGLKYNEVLLRVYNNLSDISNHKTNNSIKFNSTTVHSYSITTDLQCKIRNWKQYDIDYWNTFGISIDWLKYADVYPISHKIVIKEGNKFIFNADKYAYAYVERKDNKVTLKIYQPFNTKGYKWSNKHDRSVISLWTKIPEYGEQLIICSSMKDALCVWINTGIPCLAIQGEGYNISSTAINELKRRYKEIYILLDNDEAGLKDGLSLSESTGFINLVLPNYGAKDCSDLFKLLNNKDKFKQVIFSLINEK